MKNKTCKKCLHKTIFISRFNLNKYTICSLYYKDISRTRKACGNFSPKSKPWEDDGWDDGTMTNPEQER